MRWQKKASQSVRWSVILVVVAAGVAAGEGTGRRGEIGVQIGARWLDREIVPEDSRGVNMALGLEGAWSLNHKWVIFGDVNRSKHDSIEMCQGSEGCYARTPVVRLSTLTVGIERRRVDRGAQRALAGDHTEQPFVVVDHGGDVQAASAELISSFSALSAGPAT